jgi:hypothetical protein
MIMMGPSVGNLPVAESKVPKDDLKPGNAVNVQASEEDN